MTEGDHVVLGIDMGAERWSALERAGVALRLVADTYRMEASTCPWMEGHAPPRQVDTVVGAPCGDGGQDTVLHATDGITLWSGMTLDRKIACLRAEKNKDDEKDEDGDDEDDDDEGEDDEEEDDEEDDEDGDDEGEDDEDGDDEEEDDKDEDDKNEEDEKDDK